MELGRPLDGKIHERGLRVTISDVELEGKQHHEGEKKSNERRNGDCLESSREAGFYHFMWRGGTRAPWLRGKEAAGSASSKHIALRTNTERESRESHPYSHRTTIKYRYLSSCFLILAPYCSD